MKYNDLLLFYLCGNNQFLDLEKNDYNKPQKKKKSDMSERAYN